MKKFLFFASALAGLFLAASCQRESLEPEVTGGVTYEISLPDGPQTKGETGYDSYSLHYEVYKTAGNAEALADTPLLFEKTVTMTGNKTTVTLDLLNDQDYTVLFWATKEGTDYFDLKDLRAVGVKQATSNNDDRDAFCGMDQIENHDAAQSKTVTLTRPFAKLNIATLVSTNDYDIKPQSSLVKLTSIPTAFNVFTGEPVGANTEVTYTVNNVPEGYLTVNGTAYKKVAMNYLLVPESNISVYYEINTPNGTVKNTIDNVPVKKNYRTNIIGNLLTSNATYTVDIQPGFEESTYVGPEFVMEPKKDSEGNYVITNKYELLWLAAAVNGTLPGVETKAASSAQTFKGKTFKLSEDVDLENMEWTPIGNSTNTFQGTFDGNGKTVKNLLITGSNSYVGLFGYTTDGEIKNLTVENAKVSGRLGVGVVAGSPYTSKYTDITVTGHIEVNGMAYVGGVGGRNAYADWTDITVNADETSYVNANSVENGTAYRTYVGGVVGFNGEGGHSFKNISSNIDVTGSTIDVGGLFGIAHYGNTFENCSCSGDVEITDAAEAADAEEIGGIAGVWNNGGANVTFDNCTFTGALMANITEGVDLSDNTIVGNPYSKTGTGKLIIDGKEFGIVAEIPAEVDLGDGNTVVLPALKADHKVLVKGNGTLVLAGTTIESAEGAALELASGAAVTLRIDDEVALTGAAQGILVPADATLLVKGAGNLAVVGNAGSGIDGSVEISSLAHITAKGNGDHAFGIGGNGSTVVIDNSTIDYVCGGHVQPLFVNDTKYGKSEPEGAPAIGGAKVIIRNNSVVTKADGGSKAAAIGAQYWQSTDIEILNSTIVEANGGNASAGIGGSRYASEAKYNVNIKIENSKVTATGGQFGAGIGAGYDTHCNGQAYEAVNHIEISGTSVINAKGGKYAPGIGTGYHSAYLTGSIAEGVEVNAEAGDETFYKDAYSTAQNIGYGVVDPAREFSGKNAVVTFTVAGKVIDYPLPYVNDEEAKELLIYGVDGLLYLAEEVNKHSNYEYPYQDWTVKLMNDIDLGGIEWTPIGDYRFSANRFCGTFEGQGHTISNFKITKKTDKNDSNKSSYGFFGNLEGTVKNLTIDNASVSSYAYTGALAGRFNSGLIENCHVTNSQVENSYWQGGILIGQVNAGENTESVVKGCTVSSSSITSASAVGALSGPVTATKGGKIKFENCSVTGCEMIQNGSFGSSYDRLFGTMFGYLEANDNEASAIEINGCKVITTTVKGSAEAPVSGDFDGNIYVDGAVAVSNAAALVSAVKAGGKICLVSDIEMTEQIAVSNADFTLDGSGYTISQADDCTNTYALFDITGGNASIKNVIFDGVKNGAAVRTVNAEFVADNITVQNAVHTTGQGLIRLLGKSTITNSIFRDNTCLMTVSLNFDGDNNDPQIVENCVFENNTCNKTGVLYYVTGEKATIRGNKFIGNTVNCKDNGATVYMGFTENNVVTNNLFQNNTVNEAGTSSRVAGGVFFGYETEFTGNAFIGNSVTGTNAKGNDVCVSTYYTDIDLSGNYWGGNAPVVDVNYFQQHKDMGHEVIINDYLTANPIL